MAYRLSFLVVPRSVNSRTDLHPQRREAVEPQQAVPCNLVNNIDIHGLLTKRGVKMAGYWERFCFWVFVEQDRVQVHKFSEKKKNEANVQPP